MFIGYLVMKSRPVTAYLKYFLSFVKIVALATLIFKKCISKSALYDLVILREFS